MGGSSAQVTPAPVSAPPMGAGARGSSNPDDAEFLVSQLTQAQQMELQGAFRQFDVNGNGTMCAPRMPSRPDRPASRRQ